MLNSSTDNNKKQFLSAARYFLASTLTSTAGAVTAHYLCVHNFGTPKDASATWHRDYPVYSAVFTVAFAMITTLKSGDYLNTPIAFTLMYYPMSFVLSMFGVIAAAIQNTPATQSGYHSYSEETSVRSGEKHAEEHLLD